MTFFDIIYYTIECSDRLEIKMEQIPQIPERWFSTKEMCTYLGVTRDTLLTWINEKGMPAHKVGRGWKYKPSEVDEWIKSGKAAE